MSTSTSEKKSADKKELASKRRYLFFRNLFYVFGFFFVLLVSGHFLMNQQFFQEWALNSANKILKMEIQWDSMTFNGARGQFEGEKLEIKIPKAKTTIKLDKFRLVLDPLRIIFKKVHLVDLEAKGLHIDMASWPKTKGQTREERAQKNLTELLRVFSFKQAHINQILWSISDKTIVVVEDIQINEERGFFFRHALEVGMQKMSLISPKFDFFSPKLDIAGKFEVTYDDEAKKNRPEFKGRLVLSEALFGFNKKSLPWNDSPSWDESLRPILEQRYLEKIPENRTFAYVDILDLPLTYETDYLGVDQGLIKAFGTQTSLKGYWDQARERVDFEIKTLSPGTLALLPLGKSTFRRSFKEFDLSLAVKGSLKDWNQGEGDLKLQAKLLGNPALPELGPVTINGQGKYKDGVIQLTPIKAEVDGGTLEVNGDINLNTLEVQAKAKAKKFDAHTTVRTFSTIDIPGKVDATGTLKGSLTDPQLELKLKSSDFGYESLKFGSFDGKLTIQDRILSLTGKSLLQGVGKGNLELKVYELYNTPIQVVDLKTKVTQVPVGPLLSTEKMSGSVKGFFNLTKHRDYYEGDGLIDASNLNWLGVPIQSAKADVKMIQKRLSLKDIKINWGGTARSSFVSEPFNFDFTTEGFTFQGKAMPSVVLEGDYIYEDSQYLRFKIKAQKTDLSFLKPVIPWDVQSMSAAGVFDVVYYFPDPYQIKVSGNFNHFEYVSPDQRFKLLNSTQVKFSPRQLDLNQASVQFGRGKLVLNGPLEFYGNSNLQIKGQLDLAQLIGIQEKLVEGEGLAQTDVIWRGTVKEPDFRGKMNFKGADLRLRQIQGELTDTHGQVQFEGDRFRFENFRTYYDDAPLSLNGWAELASDNRLAAADLNIKTQEFSVTEPGSWRALLDADVRLSGGLGGLKLYGKVTLVEGLYYKDYVLTDFLLKPVGVSHLDDNEFSLLFQDIFLDLYLKSAGEFEVKNNLIDLGLTADLRIKGKTNSPRVFGEVNVTEGELQLFGITYEDASGFLSFRGENPVNPFVEFSASQEIQDYEVRAKIEGPLANLETKLESVPALNHNDIVSLIAYGRTPDQLTSSNRNLFSRTAIASQVIGLFQGPLSDLTKLDIVRVNSFDDTGEPTESSRFSIGKRISPRFALTFTTDLSLDEAYKGFELEYRLLDNLLIKASKDTGSQYRIDLTWRLQAY